MTQANIDTQETCRLGWVALNSAAEDGNVALVELLLQIGAELNVDYLKTEFFC